MGLPNDEVSLAQMMARSLQTLVLSLEMMQVTEAR